MKDHYRSYRWGIILLGLVIFLLAVGNIFWMEVRVGVLISTMLIVAFHAYFPLWVYTDQITLLHILGLGLGFVYGFPLSICAVTLGILGGALARLVREKGPARRLFTQADPWLEIGVQLGSNLIPLAWVWAGLSWMGRDVLKIFQVLESFGALTVILVGFVVLHAFLFLLKTMLVREKGRAVQPRSIFSILLVNIVPLPFIIIIIETHLDTPRQAFLILASSLTIVQVLLHRLGRYRSQVDRQIEELSTLNQVSMTLQATLDLDQLLPIIHREITSFLEIDNFYVALYDRDRQELWYPLAVKHNIRHHWPRRPVEDRLTDRVILEREPILLTPNDLRGSDPLGLPPSAETPQAWMGVPLISSERTLGCLAVMGFEEEIDFTPADLDLLNTVSGQVSVAIENALLYENIQRRASQLESLNQLSQVISSSLDLNKVLAQICDAVQEVEGGARNAVYLWDDEKDHATLAFSRGLTERFKEERQREPLGVSGKPEEVQVVPDVSALDVFEAEREGFEQENIRAVATFPLTTVEGPLGYLQVYYDEIHDWESQQLDLLNNFASQAAMAVSNARLYARTDEALSRRVQQLSMLEQVSRELSAELDLERLFQLILQSALRLTKAEMGAVIVVQREERSAEIKVTRGYTSDFPETPHLEGIVGRAFRTKQTQNVPDVRADGDYHDLTGGRTLSQLSVPLLHDQRLLGVINLESEQRNAFSASDQTFISQLADQAAIALVNAELYQETEERLREQTLLYEFSSQVSGTLDTRVLMKTILQAMAEVIEPTTGGMYRWKTGEKRYVLLPGLTLPNAVEHLSEQLGTKQAQQIVQENLSVQMKEECCQACRCVGFSLTSAGDPLAFAVFHIPGERRLSDQEHKLLETMAFQGAITLQSARLFANATQERDRLDAVLDSVDEAILMVTRQGDVLLANQLIHQFTGEDLAHILGERVDRLPEPVLRILGCYAEGVTPLEQIWDPRQRTWPMKETYQAQRKNGERYYERGVFPVGQDQEELQGVVIVIRDITEQIQIQQERKLISETLVHDLRSPASAILGSLDLIDEVITPEETNDIIAQSLVVARRGTDRILRLIQSMLEISRMESGTLELKWSEADLTEIGQELYAEAVSRANQVGIILQKDFVPVDPLFLDEEKIKRVINNLLDNALKFTPEGGKIVLSTVSADQGVLFRVRDTGPGVPKEYREKIFDRFVQVPNQWSRVRGSGLGLTFCRLVVEAHGGEIWVEDHPEGGSVFSFHLPGEIPRAELEE